MTADKVSELVAALRGLYPNPKTALHYENPFQLLIAAMLSAQCTDKRVNKITAKLFEEFKKPVDFVEAGEQELAERIKSCGLFRNKSRNIVAACRMLEEEYDGKVPRDFESLTKLPGVGRKTANVVLANAFSIPAFAVDTHVHRVANRLGLADSKDVRGTEEDVKHQVPKEDWIDLHHLLINHGRAVCRARDPKCAACPLTGLCAYYRKHRADDC